MSLARPAIALLAVVSLAPAAPVPKEAKKAVSFPYTVGTKWEYIRNGDPKTVWVKEVVECEEKEGVVTFKVNVTTDTGEKRFDLYRLKDGELVITANQNGSFDPPMPVVKAGMKTGDEWQSEVTQNGGGVEVNIQFTFTVGKPEEVVTPAGKFTATPITRKESEERTSILWYADGVGMIKHTVKGQKEPVQELRSFTPGKDKK